ncbi:MAG: T9SS type A sorting domain-containing protein, partial [Saprospiraceae bacterium]|nr:T9SS type A sorting domain-containing protein [Saprospiraceae bacterium]
GITIYGNDSLSHNLEISNNLFIDHKSNGIFVSKADSIIIRNNIIKPSDSSISGNGIYLSQCDSGFSIQQNQIIANPTNYYNGINVSDITSAPTSQNIIANNYVSITSGTIASSGMRIANSTDIDIIYNSILLKNGITDCKGIYFLGTLSNMKVLNNNIANLSGGYAYLSYDQNDISQVDYNNLYTTGQYIGYYGNSSRATLADMQSASNKNLNSISVNPAFENDSSFHAFNSLLNGAATPIAGLTTDIEGEARNASTPDIGCDEFLPSYMKGYYTIGTAGTEDYASFNAAVFDLSTRGIDSACVFEATTGTYNEQISIPAITGSSTSNTITFQSYSGDSTDVILTFDADSAANNYVIELDGTGYITIKSLTLKSVDTLYCNAIRFNGSNTNVNILNNIVEAAVINIDNYSSHIDQTAIVCAYTNSDSLTINNNVILNGSYGFRWQDLSSTPKKLSFNNNFIKGFSAWGLGVLDNQNTTAIVDRNTFEVNSIKYPYGGGVQFYHTGEFTFSNNTIYATSWGKSLSISNSSNQNSIVYNNFIADSTVTAGIEGINLNSCQHLKIYNNSVNLNSYSLYAENNCDSIEIYNNIFEKAGTGWIFRVFNNCTNFKLEYNNLRNNGGDFVQLYDSSYTDITSYKTTGNGLHSISINPQFVSNANLHAKAFDLYRAGKNVGITTDIDGESRFVTAPCIGADEFTPPANDAGILSITTSDACEGQQIVTAEIRNFGINTLTSATINCKINNISQTPFNWTGSLASSDTIFVVIDTTLITNSSQSYDYMCFTTNPNGFTDGNNLNDTFLINNQTYYTLPTVSFTGLYSTYCESDPIVILSGSPTGGTFSGVGVTGSSFTPSTAVGNSTVIYEYQDGNACFNSDTQSVTVYFNPTVSLASFSDVCVSEAAFTLSGGSPANGTYTGSGVAAGIFTPTNAGVGTHTITYKYSDLNGCIDSAQQTITVNALPNVTLASFTDVCVSEAAFTLSGGSPVNGTYTGNGVAAGIFTPTIAGVGTHTITYKYSDINGCVDSAQTTITVNALPNVTLTAFSNVCVSEPSFNLIGHSPLGGTYSGNGIIDSTFTPSNAGVGTHIITYKYSDINACVDSAQQTITVNSLPIVTLATLDSVCVSEPIVFLTGGLPTGGTYTGIGVNTSGELIPSIAGIGVHTITYKYSDVNGCIDSAQQSITVNPLPIVTLNPFSDICISEPTFTLSGGSPIGGTYYGTGISAGSFNPINAGAGTHTLSYIYSDINGCSDTAYQTIVVNSLPNVTLSAFADVCGSELPFTISGGSPVGGTYTGNGIVGGVFNPSTAGVGIHTITYKYSDINGCLDSAQQNITVNALPTVTHTLFSDVCVSAPSFTLSGGFPIGGTYTGNGVSNGNFEAFIAGVGTHTITYIYSDTNSCVDSVQKTITVNALPTVTLSSFADVCESLSPFTLTGGSPIGGTYSGNGITNGIFNPAIAGVGTHTITYAYSDINSCTDTAQKTITVNAVPIVSAGSNYSIPYGTYTTLSGSVSGSGLYSYSWSPSDSLLNANVLNPTSIPLHATTMFKLVVTDNVTGCKDSSNITITVTGGPLLANPGSNPDTICTGSSSQLSTLGSGGSGIYSYIWTSIPTGFSSTLSSPIVSPSVTTKYYVTISDGFNQSNDSVSVVVNNLPNVSLGTFSDVCVNASPVLLTGGIPTGGTYSGLGVTGGSFYPSIAGVGVHSITYSYTDGNSCINTATQTILAKALPTSTFSVNSQICSGDTATINYTGTATSGGTYNWNFDGGIIITGSGQGPYEVSWATNGIKTISLTVSENSCNSLVHTQNVIVNTNYAIATAVGNTTICDGDSVILFANTGSNLTYQWLKNDTIITGATNSFYTVKVSGNYSVLVTNNSICVSKSNIVPIIVTPVQNATFTVPTAACTFDTVTVTYTGTASASAIYQWNFDGGIIVSGSGQGPYEIYWTNSGIRNLSLQVMENSCISAIYTSSINLNSTNAIITPIGATTFCDGDSVGLYANTGANLIHQWYKNGVPISGETQPFYIASTSGNYTVLVTNTISACVAVSNVIVVTVNSTNFNLDFTAAPNSFTTPPFIVSFSNLTPNSSNYYFYWDLGDGNNSTFMQPFHTYQFDGTYTVTLIAENIQTGCRDTLTKPNYIICTGGSPNPCTVVAQITPSGSAIICPNDSLLLSATSGTGWTYQWSYNGVNIAGANSSTYYAKQTGAYRIIVTDTVCSVTSNPFILGNHQSATPVISSIDSIRPCTNDSMELYLNSFYNSYLWSTGEFTSSIFVKYSGNYTVTCTDINGCALGSAPFVVNASLLQAPEICIIGVDSANHNRIIWEKPTSVLIDSFSVYRETTVANVYSKIGTLPYSAPGIFTDLNSNPAIRAYRYKLTATDTCGSETDMSNFHKTMHLTINKGLPGTFNLIWDGYKGFPFGSYAIYRGIDSTNLSLITQIQSSLWSYTDINPPSDTVYYQIEVIKAFGCYPDSIFSKANTNYNSSRSNVANTIAVITPDTTGISTASIGKLHVNMYPNPTNGKFQIDISDLDSKTLDMCIVNMEGQIMYCEKLTNVSSGKLTKHLDFSTYPKGIYFIRIITDNIVKTKKVIIE